jgi:hypothetical protein
MHSSEYTSNQDLVMKNQRISSLEQLVMDLRNELEVERKMVVQYGNELNTAVQG